jgi:hypothetical protein
VRVVFPLIGILLGGAAGVMFAAAASFILALGGPLHTGAPSWSMLDYAAVAAPIVLGVLAGGGAGVLLARPMSTGVGLFAGVAAGALMGGFAGLVCVGLDWSDRGLAGSPDFGVMLVPVAVGVVVGIVPWRWLSRAERAR